MCTFDTKKIFFFRIKKLFALYFIIMNSNKILSDFESGISKFISGQSVDCVIIGYENEELRVLLLKWKHAEIWGLPGGFINMDEDMDKAAERVLKERTGLEFPFLSQFYTFGDCQRRNMDHTRELLKLMGMKSQSLNQWFSQRFITTGYLAPVNIRECGKPEPDNLSSRCEWVPAKKIPELAFDHKQIIGKALEHLRIRINYLPLGRTLLPETFTMKELQKLYEAVLGRQLDRGNFQRKILKLDMLVRLNKKPDAGAHKAPYLYRFDPVKYTDRSHRGIGFNLMDINGKKKA